jgi:hypothetical protein
MNRVKSDDKVVERISTLLDIALKMQPSKFAVVLHFHFLLLGLEFLNMEPLLAKTQPYGKKRFGPPRFHVRGNASKGVNHGSNIP